MNTKIIVPVVGAAAVVGGLMLFGAIQPSPITLNPTTAKHVVWDKPTTDAQWAEDVKKENFDIKSTGVLDTMITTHTDKLAREEEAFTKISQCLDCNYWEAREGFASSYPDMSEAELHAEATKQAQEKYNSALWSIEKLKQSVERMNKEVELRDKGFVVVEGEKRKGVLFGGTVPPDRIRHIND